MKALRSAAVRLAVLAATVIGLGRTGVPFARQDTRPGIVRLAVRVFDRGAFVPGLGLEDFEILVDGRPLPLRSLHLVDRDAVVRSEGPNDFQPYVGRRFTLIFQMFEYHPKLAEAIRDFVGRELRAGDTLDIQTPKGSYQMGAQALAGRTRRAMADRLIEIVRADINEGSRAYNSLLNELKKLVRSIGQAKSMETLETDSETESFSPELLLPRYRALQQGLDGLRRMDVALFERFAKALKPQRGQKQVLFFYQREYRPEIDPQVLNELFSDNQDKANILGDLQELFQTYGRDFTTDATGLRRVFADSGAALSLLFLNKEPERIARIAMREQSEDVFRALADVAEATGGFVETSRNPASGMANVLKKTEKLYLLDFASLNDGGGFKSLTVKVRGRDYKVFHRAGYFD